jgi:hypothetical protein
MSLLGVEKGGFAGAFLRHAFESIPSQKFSNMLVAQLVEDIDTASIKNRNSCFDCCKLFFRQLERSSEAWYVYNHTNSLQFIESHFLSRFSPLELREALVTLSKTISYRLEKKIKQGGEFASPTVQVACHERAILIMFRHWTSQSIVPAIHRALSSNSAATTADPQVLAFVDEFISFIATGDASSLKKIHTEANWPVSTQKQVKKYANKWRRRLIVALTRYTDAAALRAQRGPLFDGDGDCSMLEETQETDLQSLSNAVHTYRLCKYVRLHSPR